VDFDSRHTDGRMVADPDFTQIRTDRLFIRRFRSEDVEAFAGYRSDPDVARYQSWDTYTREQAEMFAAESAEIDPGIPGAWFQFAVADAVNDVLLGDTALRVVADDRSRAELGFTFAPAHQGKGYATEAASATVDYAFVRLGVDTVVAFVDSRNARSIALLERVGMTYVSSERVFVKEEWCTDQMYEVRRSVT
jgi:RimJ/RimL family protein N-acetyltransferase